MYETLLATKLRIPPVRARSVSRQRLVDRLNASLSHELILISAPAGFGKTTLLSEWANQAAVLVTWISLDEADRDPRRFLAYVTAALASVAPDLGSSVLPLLQAPQPSPIETVLTVLINRLTEASAPFVLVLDDYQLIDASPVPDALSFLLEHLPSPMHLILSTRADPPLPLARLRARGQLAELRAADLVFSQDECTALLKSIMSLELTSGDIDALVERTEGWPTGLQLAGLSLQGKGSLANFIARFTGGHEYIVDYLVDEVLNQQPEFVKRFLLETSILDHLSGPLCNAVTGHEDGTEMLAMLERRNIFILPLDAERRWYRYHRLFADVLQQRLQVTAPEQTVELHRRASQWLALNGYTVEAIRHALAARDYDLMVDLVAQAAEPLLMRSETATLLHWIAQLPDDRVRQHIALCACHAWCLLLSGHPLEAVEARLQDVDKTEPAMALPVRSFVALYRGHLVDAQNMAAQALEHLPAQQGFMRSVAQWVADIARLMSMKLSDVGDQLFQTTFGQRTSSVMTIINLCHLAEIRMRQRQLHDAKSLYERALSLAVDPQGELLPVAGMAQMGLGALAYEWNDLDAAEEYFQQGMELTAQWSEIGSLDGYLGLSAVRRAQGEFPAACRALQEAKRLAVRFDATEIDDDLVNIVEMRLFLAEGHLEPAEQWVREHRLGDDSLGHATALNRLPAIDYHLRHHQALILVRLHMAHQRFDQAAVLLDTLLAVMTERGWLDSRREIEVQALRAMCLHALARHDEALIALARALELAEPVGYIRTFVDEGPLMAELLHEAVGQGMHPNYTRSLLTAFVSSPTPQPAYEQSVDLVEPLSEREIEVLRLMAEGLTNREIADQLHLAPTTVKVHARNIYGKLGANNRTQAAARARAIGLLP
jgi:LuxR family maltose regulon positive regulatory protein